MPATAYILSGIVFGLGAGISPGPMLALVVSETVTRGRRAGLLIACAPLITDAPIVAGAVLLMSRLARSDLALGAIAAVGALFLGTLAYKSLTSPVRVPPGEATAAGSLARGVAANFLNPNPYLFWSLVGGPTVIRAAEGGLADSGLWPPVAFLGGFYLCLVGSKIVIALVVDRSRRLLNTRAYTWTVRALGLALLLFALLFVRDALRFFGWI